MTAISLLYTANKNGFKWYLITFLPRFPPISFITKHRVENQIVSQFTNTGIFKLYFTTFFRYEEDRGDERVDEIIQNPLE